MEEWMLGGRRMVGRVGMEAGLRVRGLLGCCRDVYISYFAIHPYQTVSPTPISCVSANLRTDTPRLSISSNQCLLSASMMWTVY